MEDRSDTIKVRIEPSLKVAFDAVCAEQDRTVSQILRDMIRSYVREHRQADLLQHHKPARGRK